MIPYVGTVKGIQKTITGVNYITGEQLFVGDRVANGVGTLTSLIPIPGAKYVGKYGTEAAIDAGSWVAKQFGKDASKLNKATEDITSIYRAVSPEEFYQIMDTGTFEVSIRGYDGKQFGLNFEETLEFANRFKDIGAIVEVKLPRDELNRIADFTHVDPFIFKSGTITIDIEQLEEFNKIVREIKYKF